MLASDVVVRGEINLIKEQEDISDTRRNMEKKCSRIATEI